MKVEPSDLKYHFPKTGNQVVIIRYAGVLLLIIGAFFMVISKRRRNISK
ncbi:LPXTG cell wall anchor domain-containing protein [Bacillus mycoides]